MNTLRRLLCWLEIHDAEIIYRDAGAVFTTGWGRWYDEIWISGDILRCTRPGCNKLVIEPEIRSLRKTEVAIA